MYKQVNQKQKCVRMENVSAAAVEQVRWGSVKGKDVFLFEMKNSRGTRLYVSNYGATAQALFVADSKGRFADVLLGYDTLAEYKADAYYMGGVVGRYANRIAGSAVWIDGKKFVLPVREGGYHLHGGVEGFNKKVFDFDHTEKDGSQSIAFHYTSTDGEEGFPGNLHLTVRYTLDATDQWLVEYNAVCDKTTLLNLTQHAYFNLSGQPQRGIASHELKIAAPLYLPVSAMQVPTGTIAPVVDTPFDFTKAKPIGKDIAQPNNQLQLSAGYDHSFVLEVEHTPALKPAATVREPVSGRVMDVFTTEPAVHFYSGNFLGGIQGKNGISYKPRSGFCLETQHFPDAPNHPHFPTTVLRAGEPFYSKTVFAFSS